MKASRLRRLTNIVQSAILFVSVFLILMSAVACSTGELVPTEVEMTLTMSSPVFQEGEEIPVEYTCEGEDISPPLTWDEPPSETQSLVLIMDDPDVPVGVFTHWILFNITSGSRELPEAVLAQDQPSGALHGKNSFGEISYGGPCPPSGSPHRYRFTLYALDQHLDLEAGASKEQVIESMQGHVLARGQLTGTYQR